MRFVVIEKKEGTEKVILNVDQICSVYMHDTAVISTSDGRQLETKFTNLSAAIDYIRRSAMPNIPYNEDIYTGSTT